MTPDLVGREYNSHPLQTGYPKHFSDPGVRGSARIVDDKLVLGFDLVPFDQPCEGTSSTYHDLR